MIVLHSSQTEAFEAPMLENFVVQMTVHLRTHFPEQTEEADDVELREFILDGTARAEAHGYVAERDVCKYIDLMIAFGPDFDTDPQLEWNAGIDNELLPPHLRIEKVYDDALASVRTSPTAGRPC